MPILNIDATKLQPQNIKSQLTAISYKTFLVELNFFLKQKVSVK